MDIYIFVAGDRFLSPEQEIHAQLPHRSQLPAQQQLQEHLYPPEARLGVPQPRVLSSCSSSSCSSRNGGRDPLQVAEHLMLDGGTHIRASTESVGAEVNIYKYIYAYV